MLEKIENILSSLNKTKILFLLLSILFISASGLRDFHSRGEAREALVVQDMLNNQHYILANGYSDFVPSKPPLFHWVSLLASFISGQVTEFTARFPSVLSAVLIGMLFYSFLIRHTDKNNAFNTSFLLATAFEWTRSASAARVDMLLTCAVVTSLICIFEWHNNNYKGYPYILLIALSAAALTKGPVGIVLPGFIFVVFSLLKREKFVSIFLRSLYVFLPALALVSVWYYAAYLERPKEFLDKVYYENVARFLGQQEDEPHKASIFKLYFTVFLGFMPWSLILLFIGIKEKQLIKEYVKNFKSNLKKLDNLSLFSLVVIICTLFFYSIPESKRSVYLLPLYPFLAFLLAKSFNIQSAASVINISKKYFNVFFILLLLLVPLIFLLSLFSITVLLEEFCTEFIKVYLTHSFYIIALIIAYLTFLALRKYSTASFDLLYKVFVLIFSINVFLQIFIIPPIVNPISARRFAQEIAPQIQKADRVISFDEEFYSISFYANKKFYRLEDFPARSGDLVILDQKDLDEFNKLGYKSELIIDSNHSVISYGKELLVLKVL